MDLTRPYPPEPYSLLPAVPSFVLTSTDIRDGEMMDIRHSVDGGSISPQLSWSGAPAATGAYAVSCFDPDAPTPAGYWHWTILNLPADMTEIPRDFGNVDHPIPAGAVRARNDGGTMGYAGAAPPPGDHAHRYIYAVHALDEPIDVPQGIACTPAAFMSLFHTIARATLAPMYQR